MQTLFISQPHLLTVQNQLNNYKFQYSAAHIITPESIKKKKKTQT